MSQSVSFNQWLDGLRRAEVDIELTGLLQDITRACKSLAHLVRQGEIAGVLGAAGTENVQGEDQKKLDIIANEVFIQSTEGSGRLAALASEEMDHMHPIPQGVTPGRYLLTFDPLDGSSNIDVNGSVGTIFSITENAENTTANDSSFLISGNQQVCAGYCLYSSATMLVLTLKQGVYGFTLDATTGEFLLTHPDMQIPVDTNEYAINSSNSRYWQPPLKQYIDELQAGTEGSREKNFNMRWAGSMVGDIHRILCRGGIFLYPIDTKLIAANKQGKLRLLYEANPMGLIVEQAGGLASTGIEPILDIVPDTLHQRVPVIMGSRAEVERVVTYHQQYQ